MSGNAKLALMKTQGKLMCLNMLRLNMWNLQDIIVQFVGISVRLFLLIRVTLRETIEIEDLFMYLKRRLHVCILKFINKALFHLFTQFCLKSMPTWRFLLTCKRQLLGTGPVLLVATPPATEPTCTSMSRQNMSKPKGTAVHTALSFVQISNP